MFVAVLVVVGGLGAALYFIPTFRAWVFSKLGITPPAA
jgi:hypothetical protein